MTGRRLGTAALGLLLVLTACGSQEQPEATSTSASDAASSAPPAPECPLQATEVEAPDGVGTDLATKPTVPPQSAPPPSELTYADVVEGEGETAQAGDQVQAKYLGAFYESGEEFDSSWSNGPDSTLPFGLCLRGVIPGFAAGPIGMEVGGRRLITIPAEYGYGAQGQGPVPPDATLVFVVDLVSID